MRRTTSPSSPTARCWSRPARRARCFDLSGDPVSAVLLTRVPAQQATMIARAGDRTFIATANPGLLLSVSAGARDARHLRIGREGRAAGLDVGRDDLARHGAGRRRRSRSSRARATPGRPDEAWSEWSGAVRKRRRLADHQPEGALPAVARRPDRNGDGRAGADVALVGLPAAQHPAAGGLDHRAPARRGVPEAVLERRDRDCRPR